MVFIIMHAAISACGFLKVEGSYMRVSTVLQFIRPKSSLLCFYLCSFCFLEVAAEIQHGKDEARPQRNRQCYGVCSFQSHGIEEICSSEILRDIPNC